MLRCMLGLLRVSDSLESAAAGYCPVGGPVAEHAEVNWDAVHAAVRAKHSRQRVLLGPSRAGLQQASVSQVVRCAGCCQASLLLQHLHMLCSSFLEPRSMLGVTRQQSMKAVHWCTLTHSRSMFVNGLTRACSRESQSLSTYQLQWDCYRVTQLITPVCRVAFGLIHSVRSQLGTHAQWHTQL